MLRHATSSLIAAWALVVLSAGAAAAIDTSNKNPSTPPPSAVASPTDDGYEVNVTSSSTLPGNTPYQQTRTIRVPAMCWMAAGLTGIEYARNWSPGGKDYVNNANGGYPWERLVYDDYMSHADSEGRWYSPTCRPDAPSAYTVGYLDAHPVRFVEPQEPAPRPDPQIDPEVLAHAARDAMVLPTGTIRWNPSLDGTRATVVNMPTFIWVEGATDTVTVRAEVVETGTWAQVDAHMVELRLEAKNHATASTCTTLGTPYAPGMTASDCSIEFYRSTAGQPVKPGQTLPTVTLNAAAVWTAEWTSSLTDGPQALPVNDTTTTAEVPVAEIQTIVTS